MPTDNVPDTEHTAILNDSKHKHHTLLTAWSHHYMKQWQRHASAGGQRSAAAAAAALLIVHRRCVLTRQVVAFSITRLGICESPVISLPQLCRWHVRTWFKAGLSTGAYAVITTAIRLRYDYDPTTTYHAHLLLLLFAASKKSNMSIFRRNHVVVVSQSNRNCDIGFI